MIPESFGINVPAYDPSYEVHDEVIEHSVKYGQDTVDEHDPNAVSKNKLPDT